MKTNKSGGDMFPNHYTANPLGGKCLHDCHGYCYVKDFTIPFLKEKYSGEIRLIPKVLTGNTGRGKTIFLCNCNDMFQSRVKEEDIMAIMKECRRFQDNTYLFQTKNPVRMLDWVKDLPPRSILATTIETDDQELLNEHSKAPPVMDRAIAMGKLRLEADELNTIVGVKTETQVTIEPIMSFTKERLIKLMEIAQPDIIYIGADSEDGACLCNSTEEEIIEWLRDNYPHQSISQDTFGWYVGDRYKDTIGD